MEMMNKPAAIIILAAAFLWLLSWSIAVKMSNSTSKIEADIAPIQTA